MKSYLHLVLCVLLFIGSIISSVQFILRSFDPYGLWPIRYGTCQYRNKVTNIIHDVRYNRYNTISGCI